MKPKCSSIVLLILLVFVITACDLAPSTGNDRLSQLNRDGLGTYTASFTIQFDGSSDWIYRLQSRRSAALREESLHIEGVDPALNPGDIRMVTDGKSTWMAGAGTDNECVQFPNNAGMDPELIRPETVLSPAQLSGALKYVSDEEILGKKAEHWNGSGLTIGEWQNARIDIWMEKNSKALLRMILQASSEEDPFFGTGAGTLTAGYDVSELGNPAIEPVSGCEIAVPLPDSAQQVVRLPGMASFETSAALEEVKSFYQTVLAQEAWAESEPASTGEGALVLSYRRGEEAVEIQIRTKEAGGSKVQLIFP